MQLRSQNRPALLAAPVAVLLAAAPAVADKALLKMRAFAVDMSGGSRASAGTVDITIERWTTDEEKQRLKDVLVEKGADKLRDALEKIEPRAGYINTTGSLGWDLHYATESELPDGARRIIVATDRPMSFWESRNNPRLSDYEFLLLEIRLDKEGKGQGKMAVAAKIDYNEVSRTIEIENYTSEPVRLTKVEVVEPKPKG
jgi:hypothetical protein